MNYFRQTWNESRGDKFDNWGTSIFFIETDDDGLPIRQIEVYEKGLTLKYGQDKLSDQYGGLGDQELKLSEWKNFEITQAEFELVWNK